MTERERAFHLLQRVENESAFASLLLQNESGFVRTLVLGVLRWRLRLDDAIEKLAKRRVSKLDRNIVDVLRLGIFQLMFTDVAPYAAVSESVDLARRYARRAAGLVNAVLRRASETDLRALATELATRTSHPEWLLRRWTQIYGTERTARIAEANQELSYPDLFGGAPPPSAAPSKFVSGMYKLTGSSADVEGYAMDEGSAVIADIASSAGRDVLDLAAAPGGKTIVMTARGTGVISNDISIGRLRTLMSRWRKLVVSDGRTPVFRRQFQTVLLDAPCSATGTIRKNPEIKWRLREGDIARFTVLQKELLTSALDLARETVVYSTCSLEREENDDVVREVLALRHDFAPADVGPLANGEARLWIEDGVLRLTPESGADGFTAHLLQRIH